MKKIVVIILGVLSVVVASAQQDPQFSQNMFNKLANNPGFAGSRGVVATSVLHRSQWMGFGEDGGAAASTQNFSIDAAYEHIFMKDKSIDAVKQAGYVNGVPQETDTVQATYSGSANIFALGMNWKF